MYSHKCLPLTHNHWRTKDIFSGMLNISLKTYIIKIQIMNTKLYWEITHISKL